MDNLDKNLKETFEYSAEDAKFMDMAIRLSIENIDTGGGPFGAVIVRDGEIISTGANRVVPNSDPTAHAEVMAIRNACSKLGTFQLTGCTVYSSCEPCPMCLWAILQSRIKNLYFGAYDTIMGGVSTLPQIPQITNSKTIIKGGIMETECKTILDNYFENIRDKQNAKD